MVEKLLNIQQIFTKFSLKSKLKKNLCALLILLENLLWIGFNEGNLEVFKPKVWELLKFVPLDIQLNTKNDFENKTLIG
jgi:hypothetical protein